MKKAALVLILMLAVLPAKAKDCAVPTAYQPKWAKSFSFEYGPGYKVLKILSPWQNSGTTHQFLIAQSCAVIPKKYSEIERIPTNPKRVVALSTTYLPFFSILGLEDRLVGAVDRMWVNAAWARERIKKGQTKTFGPEITDHLEELLSTQPDLVMGFGLSEKVAKEKAQLKRLGLVMILSAAHLEDSPLGRAEWVLAFASIFDLEAKAEAHMVRVAAEYLALAKQVAQVKARPTVFVGSEYKGIWYLPGGLTYQAKIVADAGGDYLWGDSKLRGSHHLDFEAVLEKAADAQFWINAGRRTDLSDLQGGRFQGFKAIREGRVFNYVKRLNPEGGNDYWETGSAYPNRMLKDLVKILHPQLLPGHELYWYRRLQ